MKNKRKFKYSGLFLILISVPVYFWTASNSEKKKAFEQSDPISDSWRKAKLPTQSQVTTPQTNPTNRLPSSLTPIQFGMRPSHLIRKIRFKNLLASQITPSRLSDFSREIQIFETEGKYPFIRTVRTFRIDENTGEEVTRSEVSAIADHLIVHLKTGKDIKEIGKLLSNENALVRRKLPGHSLYIVAVSKFEPEDFDALDRLKLSLKQHPAVNSVTHDLIVTP